MLQSFENWVIPKVDIVFIIKYRDGAVKNIAHLVATIQDIQSGFQRRIKSKSLKSQSEK